MYDSKGRFGNAIATLVCALSYSHERADKRCKLKESFNSHHMTHWPKRKILGKIPPRASVSALCSEKIEKSS